MAASGADLPLLQWSTNANDCPKPVIWLRTVPGWVGRVSNIGAGGQSTLTASLGEHLWSELGNFDDYIGRNVQPAGGCADGLRARRFIEAVGFALVGAQKRKQPLNPFVIINPPDVVGSLLGYFHFFGKIPLD